MKAVAADALIVKALRQGEVIRQGVMTAMKSGVETCDLRQFGPGSEQQSDRREVVGLVQRRQRDVALQARDNLLVDDDRLVEIGAAMNDAVADRDEGGLLRLAEPVAHRRHRCSNIGYFVRRKSLVDQRRPVLAFGAQRRANADTVHLPAEQAPRLPSFANREYLEFYARRAGVDDENCFHGRSRCG